MLRLLGHSLAGAAAMGVVFFLTPAGTVAGAVLGIAVALLRRRG